MTRGELRPGDQGADIKHFVAQTKLAHKIGRVVAVRLSPGEDLLEGLTEACKKHSLNNGLILTGIGSLRAARFFNPVPLPDRKIGYGYGEPIALAGPIELLAATGMICKGDDGQTLFHVHLSLSDQNGGGWGGHLIEGNKVLITADFVLAEIEDMSMGRRYNEDVELMITVCPGCNVALDREQKALTESGYGPYDMPCIDFGQLIALALGVDLRKLGFEANSIPLTKVLEKVATSKGEKAHE